jgi:UDP-2,3-diacylglucosamine pyrophosphatase LpxH
MAAHYTNHERQNVTTPVFDPKRFGDFNLLVTSDLHVGVGLTDANPHWRTLLHFTRAFVSFIDFYRTHRQGDRPWKLILNGDFIDFIQVSMPPSALGVDGSEAEYRYGVESHTLSSEPKLALILARHRAIFRALARFVAAGNMLVCVTGNHDVDFCFRSVRNTFRNHLANLAGADSQGQKPTSRRTFCRRIRFYPWFYFEPGLYVEHGHQYDQYTAFHYTFHPLDEMGRIDLPASHRALYYASGRADVDTGGTDQMTLADFWHWAAKKGVRGVLALAALYVEIVFRSVMRRAGLSLKAAVVQQMGINQTAKATGLPLAELRRIDRLRAVPAQSSVLEMLSMFYADRIAATGAAAAGIMASFVFMPNWSASWKSAIAIAAICGAAHVVFALRRNSESAPKLSRAAARVSAILGVRNVIFGHSHHVAVHQLENGRRYFNTGSFWAPPPEGVTGINHVRLLRDDAGLLTGGLCRVHGGEVISI